MLAERVGRNFREPMPRPALATAADAEAAADIDAEAEAGRSEAPPSERVDAARDGAFELRCDPASENCDADAELNAAAAVAAPAATRVTAVGRLSRK